MFSDSAFPDQEFDFSFSSPFLGDVFLSHFVSVFSSRWRAPCNISTSRSTMTPKSKSPCSSHFFLNAFFQTTYARSNVLTIFFHKAELRFHISDFKQRRRILSEKNCICSWLFSFRLEIEWVGIHKFSKCAFRSFDSPLFGFKRWMEIGKSSLGAISLHFSPQLHKSTLSCAYFH